MKSKSNSLDEKLETGLKPNIDLRNMINRIMCLAVTFIMVSTALVVMVNQPVVDQPIADDESSASTMGGHPPIWNLAMQDILMSPDPSSAGATTTITNRVINTAGGISYTSTIKGYIDNVLKSTATIPDPLYPGQTWDHIYTATATSGYHDVKGEIVNGDNIQTDNILTERHWWKGPDLIVYDLWAADLDGNQITSIAAGQQFIVRATIKNAGDLTAPTGSIVDMDMVGAGWGSAVTLSQALAPGASATVTFWGMAGDYISYIKTPGTYTITVTADAYNSVDEANTATGAGKGTAETNNVRSETFSVAKASWTVLIYTSADDPSPLEDFALQDYVDLENDIGGSNIDISIVMQLDRISGQDSGFGDWTDTHRFIVKNLRTPTVQNSIESEEYDYLGEKDMGSAATLSDFLVWGVDRFRANNYFVIFAGHGSGTGVCSDDTSGSMLGLSDLTAGFQAMTQKMASNGDGNKVDVVLFKACLDSSTEIAAQISPYVDYMVGVETVSCIWPLIIANLILWQDLPYYKMWGDGIVEYLKRYPATTPSAFAPHVVEMSNPIYNPLWPVDGEAIASVDLTQMEPLIFSVNQFSETLRNYVYAYKTLMTNALGETKIMPPDTDMMDLYQFAEKIYGQFNGVSDPVVKQDVQMVA